MGKSINRKRSKILHQRKKERENEKVSKSNNDALGFSKIKKRLDKELN